jgi:hypothetical protein
MCWDDTKRADTNQNDGRFQMPLLWFYHEALVRIFHYPNKNTNLA